MYDSIVFKILLGVVGGLASLVASWKYWSIAITKWRVWAFSRVEERDLLQLKSLAIKTKLIWDDDNAFTQTEVRATLQKQKIDAINQEIQQYEQIDHLLLDANAPDKISYKLSKLQNLFESVIMFFLLVVGVCILFTKMYPIGIVLILLVIYDIGKLQYSLHAIRGTEYFAISNEGIHIGPAEAHHLLRWETVSSIDFQSEGRKIIVQITENNSHKEFAFDLWRLESYEYETLKKYLDVYAGR
ncbi:MAG: hypothetical protein AAFV25_28170 [Bacteroidota bacterium]